MNSPVPTTISLLRAALLDRVKAVLNPHAPEQIDVIEARSSMGWFSINLRGETAVVISYAGRPKKAEGTIGRRDRQRYIYRFNIAITAGDWASPQGAVYLAADMAELLIGSPNLPDTTPNLRTEKLLNIHDEPVYLRFISEEPTIAPNSTPNGGRYALVQLWETFPEVLA